ncbi:MAG: hypothetical protein WCS62_02360 [Bacilli bacterium]
MTLNISNIILFAFTFGVTIIFFVLALNRQTIISALISWISWWALGFTTLSAVATVGQLAMGFFMLCILIGLIMMLLTFKFTFDFLTESTAEKKRRIAEEIM